MSIAIHWFRRDLRLTDNTALNAAIAAHDQIIPLYVISEWKKKHPWCGAPRQEFLCGCVELLNKSLQQSGGRLIVQKGTADKVIAKLIHEAGVDAVYFNRDPDPYGRKLEILVGEAAKQAGASVHSYKDIALVERDELLTGSGTPFRVFTPYAKAWHRIEKTEPGRTASKFSVPKEIQSDPLPTLATWALTSDADIIAPGEAAARKRLARFLDGPVFAYSAARDIPSAEATSRLSQDLRFGTLSVREIYAKCQETSKGTRSANHRRSIDVFINELIWREFYQQVLWFNPEVLSYEYQERYRHLAWQDHWRPEKQPGGEAFQRWSRGETGFPIVDAGMRQLNATGFLHNRVRMTTAMFLTKDLHVWWMHGESYFMQRLVDGEIASNNGGWQWSASTGTDAAPYFRIQNPWIQSKRFDPEGAYVKRWVPEVKDVPAGRLHAPPADVHLAKSYPLPMVDHQRERDVTLEMFRH
ncbi:MAG TPA: deoxyribodipyrimidine photo-lyase [Chthoniobacteraceae bacterium]|nr:deoxyribodipyrimidine photo-lyase [Chthoniobacteraceae bacterium]